MIKNTKNISIAARALAIGVVAALVLAGTAMGEVTRTGLVGEWHFDGDAKDTSGNGNDGMIYGASLNPTSAITIETWVKFNSLSATQYFLSKPYTSAYEPYHQYGLIALTNRKINLALTFGGNRQEFSTTQTITTGQWYHIVGTYDGSAMKVYINGTQDPTTLSISGSISTYSTNLTIGRWSPVPHFFNGIIDEVRIYNRALSDSEVKANYEASKAPPPPQLTLTKSLSPSTITEGESTTVTLRVENTGGDAKSVKITDTIPQGFTIIISSASQEYAALKATESRTFHYTVKPGGAGNFVSEKATATYSDDNGNSYTASSNTVLISVSASAIQPYTNSPTAGATPAISPAYTTPGKTSRSASVNIHGEKTEVELGEDILLKLSAVNLITKPKMHVQVILIPPSGMSVTSAEFTKSGAGQFTSNYELEPGDGKDIEVRIITNQVGDFVVTGRILYYFGDEKDKSEDYDLSMPIKVKTQALAPQQQAPPAAQPKTPGFGAILSGIGIISALALRRR